MLRAVQTDLHVSTAAGFHGGFPPLGPVQAKIAIFRALQPALWVGSFSRLARTAPGCALPASCHSVGLCTRRVRRSRHSSPSLCVRAGGCAQHATSLQACNWFGTRTLALAIGSLVRVSKRVECSHTQRCQNGNRPQRHTLRLCQLHGHPGLPLGQPQSRGAHST